MYVYEVTVLFGQHRPLPLTVLWPALTLPVAQAQVSQVRILRNSVQPVPEAGRNRARIHQTGLHHLLVKLPNVRRRRAADQPLFVARLPPQTPRMLDIQTITTYNLGGQQNEPYERRLGGRAEKSSTFSAVPLPSKHGNRIAHSHGSAKPNRQHPRLAVRLAWLSSILHIFHGSPCAIFSFEK